MTETRTINYQEVWDAAQAVLSKYGPETIYSNGSMACSYVPNPKGETEAAKQHGCIVGEIMRTLNVESFPFDSGEGISYLISCVLPEKGLQFTRKAAAFLSTAQQWQDAGNTWGDSVQAAERVEDEEL